MRRNQTVTDCFALSELPPGMSRTNPSARGFDARLGVRSDWPGAWSEDHTVRSATQKATLTVERNLAPTRTSCRARRPRWPTLRLGWQHRPAFRARRNAPESSGWLGDLRRRGTERARFRCHQWSTPGLVRAAAATVGLTTRRSGPRLGLELGSRRATSSTSEAESCRQLA